MGSTGIQDNITLQKPRENKGTENDNQGLGGICRFHI